jgi:hypothetical protein
MYVAVYWEQSVAVCCDNLLSELQGLNRTELNCLYIVLDCGLSESGDRLDKVVLGTERERESGGDVNCWLVKVQGLRVSDIVWGVEVCEGRTVDVMVVMVCLS